MSSEFFVTFCRNYAVRINWLKLPLIPLLLLPLHRVLLPVKRE